MGNDCLRERKGLLFDIRKAFITTEDGEEVMLVPKAMVEAEGAQQYILTARKIKHSPPDIQNLKKGKMRDKMVEILWAHMDSERMTEEVAEL